MVSNLFCFLFFYFYLLGELNPCSRHEKAMSLPLDEKDPFYYKFLLRRRAARVSSSLVNKGGCLHRRCGTTS